MNRHFRLLAVYFVVILVATAAIMWMPDWLPIAATREAKPLDDLFWALVWVSVVILALVMAIVVYSAIHFRARPGDMDDGAPIHGNHLLEVSWFVIPTIIVTVIGVVSYQLLVEAERAPAEGEKSIEVKVTAQQFSWTYDYPELGVKKAPQLVIPIGTTALFDITAPKGDVVHSFWAPEARMKKDAVPGLITHTQWTPKEEGDWAVVCAELCGSGHSNMRGALCVVSEDEFQTWVRAISSKDEEQKQRAAEICTVDVAVGT